MVLVVEHVAVDDELAEVVAELAGHEQLVARVEQEGLLEAVLVRWRRAPLRLSRYQSVWCRCSMWATVVLFAASR